VKKTFFTRSQAEDELVHALTRQIGYTAGGFSILRMAGIVDLFSDASAYQFELVKRLRSVGSEDNSLSEKYATDLLSFASELGIMKKLPGATAPHLSRFAVTDAGVSLRAARAVLPSLGALVLEHLVLENDADAYLSILNLLADPDVANGQVDGGARFRELVVSMRHQRLAWLEQAFPTKALLLRIMKSGSHQVHWLKADGLGRISLDEPKADFGRHHFGPRKSWAVELGHFDASAKALTARGQNFLKLAHWSPASEKNWIAPPKECTAYLRVAANDKLRGPEGPAFDLLRPDLPAIVPPAEVVQRARDFLRTSFPHIQLVHARQAPTAVLNYFLLLLEQELGVRVDPEVVIREIAKESSDEFAFFSSRTGGLAYYQLRKRADV
jgi:hypothetical protein